MKQIQCPYCGETITDSEDLYTWTCEKCCQAHECPECEGTGDGKTVMVGSMCRHRAVSYERGSNRSCKGESCLKLQSQRPE